MKEIKALVIILVLTTFTITIISCNKNDGNINNDEIELKNYYDSIYRSIDSINLILSNNITTNLKGKWQIDSLEVEYNNQLQRNQIGINSDTTFTKFGEIIFDPWEPNFTINDSTNYKNTAILVFENQFYPISFDYLLNRHYELASYTFISENFERIDEWYSNDKGTLIRDMGFLDNIQIKMINENEFHLVGLNRGIKKMKITKI